MRTFIGLAVLVALVAAFTMPVVAAERTIVFKWRHANVAEVGSFKFYMSATGEAGTFNQIAVLEKNSAVATEVNGATVYSFPAAPAITIPDGTSQTWHFYATAVDWSNNESAPSEVATAQIDLMAPTPVIFFEVEVPILPQ